MGLALSAPPGFNDLSDSQLAVNSPALGIQLAKVYENSVFSKVRTEVFSDVYSHGQTVKLPVSTRDGYAYSRSELLYFWTIRNSADPSSLWMSGKDSLGYAAWLVDQTTGQVYCDEWYRRSGTHADVTHTNDGVLQVWTVAQRQRGNLALTASPSYSAITGSWIGLDKPLTQQLAQGLNDDAKFAVLNHEFFYLGEYTNGQTVILPTSPEDGHHYTSGECKFMLSSRWTSVGSVVPMQAPPLAYGQMGPMKASINGSGVVSCSVGMIDGNGTLNQLTVLGRVAAFAFCQRTGTPGTITPTANSFAEINFDDFMPGADLPFPNVTQIANNILEGLLTPEFFGPTTHANGDTIALPTSAIDGYVYSRSECQYLWFWSDTTNQTGSNLRLPLFNGHIDPLTGVVTLHVWRLPPGVDPVDDNDSLAHISVLIVVTRKAQAPAALAAPTTSAPADLGSSASVDVADFIVQVNGSAIASGSSANFSDSTPAVPSGMRNVKWQKDALTPTDLSANVPNIGAIDARTTTSETIGLASQGKLVTLSNAGAVAASLTSTAGASFFCAVKNLGAGTATLTPSSGTINGAANLALTTGQGAWLFLDGTNWQAVTSTGAVVNTFGVVSAVTGKPAASQIVAIYTAFSAETFPANFGSPNQSYGSVGTNPTATASYTVNKNGSSVGTISISTGGVFTFTTSGGTSFSLAAGDRLTIVAPSSQDTTLADVGITLVGTR